MIRISDYEIWHFYVKLMLNLNRTPTLGCHLQRAGPIGPFSSFGDLRGRFFFVHSPDKKMPAETRAFLFFFLFKWPWIPWIAATVSELFVVIGCPAGLLLLRFTESALGNGSQVRPVV